MANEDQDERWQKTKTLALAVLAGTAALVIVLVVAGVSEAARDDGFPLGYLLVTVAAPLLVTAIVFWFARRQAAIDRQYGFFED